ncbi:MAG: transglutaminase domain-containing protein [Lachnospiraceae bacterium]
MKLKKLTAVALAAAMTIGTSMTSLAATAQDVINMNQASYTAGTNSVYGAKLSQDQLNAVAQAVADFKTNYVNDSMDNDAKIRAGYDYIKNNVSYIDWRESDFANTAYGALVEKKAACSGMTRAFVALMDAVGVKAYWIHATDNSHQWNMVEFNDGFYFIDIDANIASGAEIFYHVGTHPYAYDTASYPAIGSKSGTNTSGTTNTTTESWKQDNIGWWYQNADGSYPTNTWKEISGAWYYFEGNGYMAANKWIGNYYVGSNGAMLTNTTTPDGYQVGADGAWVQGQNDGVHTKKMNDYDANLDMNFNVLEWRTDVNGNQYILVDENTTTFSFTGSLSNVDPQNLNVSMAVYKYSPENNTIYAFSQDGTAHLNMIKFIIFKLQILI